MANLTSPPPEFGLVEESIFTVLETTYLDNSKATIDFAISGSPTAGQTIQLAWTGGGVTFTAAAALATNGRNWPAITSGLFLDYVDLVLEFLRQYEPITDLFTVELLPGSTAPLTIRLTRRVSEVFDVQVVSNTFTNVVATATPITEITTPDNLTGLVAVYDPAHNQVMKLHGTYDAVTNQCPINLSPAFTMLKASLPGTNSISSNLPTWHAGTADTHMQAYYIRYADKYGTPPVAEALQKSEGPYYALIGGRSKTTKHLAANRIIRHSYLTSNGTLMHKPVNPEQPDWLYWLAIPDMLDGNTYYLQVVAEWSDGTQSTHYPFTTAPRNYVPFAINWFKCGYRQLNLHSVPVPAGTEPGSFITGYTVNLIQPGGSTILTAAFEVEQLSTPGTMFLLMENGFGGMESVWLRGAATRMYSSTKEQWRKARHYGNQSDIADIDIVFSEGRERIKLSTGLYEEESKAYLEHLQQIVHGRCWLIDTINSRFLPVIVESSQLESIIDNETLHQFNVEIVSAWINSNFTR